MKNLKIIWIGFLVFLFVGLVPSAKRVGAEEEAKTVKAPTFILPTVDGVEVSLEDYKGKFILLNFWASWCGPCRVEMPSLEKLHNTLGRENLVVLGISIDREMKDVKKFMADNKLTFTALLDPEQNVSLSYNVTGIPTTFLIDSSGWIIGGSPGARDWATPEYINFFREKMKAGGKPVKEEKVVTAEFGDISPEELRKKIKAKEKFVLLDVRNDDEFKGGHIEGAINIPVKELERRAKELDSSQDIIVYCSRGMRSAKAGEILMKLKFKKVRNMKVGYEGWKRIKALEK